MYICIKSLSRSNIAINVHHINNMLYKTKHKNTFLWKGCDDTKSTFVWLKIIHILILFFPKDFFAQYIWTLILGSLK